VALRSWRFTYKRIFSNRTIERRVSSYYSDQSFEEGVFSRLRKGDDWFCVALEGERLIGFSHIGRSEVGWELLRIYLLPRYVGKGIGKRLLQLGEKFLQTKMARRYYVSAHRRNTLAVEFYIRNGFTRVPSKDAAGEVYLEKKLRSLH
jgi:GNAT superfamily N-acetyltransferase